MRTDKDSLTVADAGAWLVLTSMQRASMMSVPLEISGPGTRKPVLERQRAAVQSQAAFFMAWCALHGRPGERSLAARRCSSGLPTLVRSPTRLGSGAAVPYRT